MRITHPFISLTVSHTQSIEAYISPFFSRALITLKRTMGTSSPQSAPVARSDEHHNESSSDLEDKKYNPDEPEDLTEML